MRIKTLCTRDIAQVCAALRLYGQWQVSQEAMGLSPMDHPLVADRFTEARCLPMTLDEIETLIGRIEGTWTGRGLKPWNPIR